MNEDEIVDTLLYDIGETLADMGVSTGDCAKVLRKLVGILEVDIKWYEEAGELEANSQ